jgi:hypothetical protein
MLATSDTFISEPMNIWGYIRRLRISSSVLKKIKAPMNIHYFPIYCRVIFKIFACFPCRDTGIHSNTPCTPLAAAASIGHNDCAQCLLDAGADPNIPDANGRFAIELAAGNDSLRNVCK